MKYVDVTWHHSHPDEPIRLVSEIGTDGFEVRKLEFFGDGRVGYASQNLTSGNTRLGKVAVPDLSEIVSDEQFSGVSIEAAEFNMLWQRYAAKSI